MSDMSLAATARELTHIILGYDPFPLYAVTHPSPERVAPSGTMVEDAERVLLFGRNSVWRDREVSKNFAPYVSCTQYIGGMEDTCRWQRFEVEKLTEEEKMFLIGWYRDAENRGIEVKI